MPGVLTSYVTTFCYTEEGLYTQKSYFVDLFYKQSQENGFCSNILNFSSQFFTGILVPTTLWIFTQGYSPTWQICSGCKMSEYLLNNVGFKHYCTISIGYYKKLQYITKVRKNKTTNYIDH